MSRSLCSLSSPRDAEPKIRGFPMRKRCRTSRTRARFFLSEIDGFTFVWSTCFPLFIQERTLTGSRALAMDSKMSVRITRPCLVLPYGKPQNPRTGGDPDTAACYPLPDYAQHGTPLIWSTLQTRRGFPRRCEKHKACDPQLRDL